MFKKILFIFVGIVVVLLISLLIFYDRSPNPYLKKKDAIQENISFVELSKSYRNFIKSAVNLNNYCDKLEIISDKWMPRGERVSLKCSKQNNINDWQEMNLVKNAFILDLELHNSDFIIKRNNYTNRSVGLINRYENWEIRYKNILLDSLVYSYSSDDNVIIFSTNIYPDLDMEIDPKVSIDDIYNKWNGADLELKSSDKKEHCFVYPKFTINFKNQGLFLNTITVSSENNYGFLLIYKFENQGTSVIFDANTGDMLDYLYFCGT